MSAFISSMTIQHFRGVRDLSISDLGTINVLAGVNNCGKTSILEVIGLLSNPLDRLNFQKWAIMRAPKDADRNKKMAEYISYLFSDGEAIAFTAEVNGEPEEISYTAAVKDISNASGVSSQVLIVRGWLEGNGNTLMDEFRFRNNGRGSYFNKKSQFRTEYIFANGDFYKNCVEHISESMLNEKKAQLLDVVRSFDNDIEDILLRNNDILLHSRQSGVQPLFNYGSGLQKAMLLAASLMNVRDNIILIDEIDSTINMSAFKDVFPWFVKMCRKLQVQAFVTTHSMEAIDAVLEATEQDGGQGLDDVRIITLRKMPKSKKTAAIVRSGNEARKEREQFGMELRV